MSETHNAGNGFNQFSLPDKLVSILERNGFHTPTPIQARAIPFGLLGRDIVGVAQTGTGKTLAFGLPMITRLLSEDGVGLVLAPTRELALQIEETLIKVGRPLGIRTAVLIGGAPMGPQVSRMRARPHIIVATPGRLMDHMTQKTVSLKGVRVVVLDEADRMLDMGFAPAIRRIMAEVTSERQTLLFSATMPSEIRELADSYMRSPERIEIARPGAAAEQIEQEMYVVDKDEKNILLEQLLRDNRGTILVFSRTRHGARKVARSVRAMGHASAELHSDRTLAQRRAALEGFKRGEYRVLVATDIAARGIDVKAISMVINYDLPDNPNDYIHRIGRTGRAGETGRAVTFAQPDQAKDVRDIERLLRSELPLAAGSRRLPAAEQKSRPMTAAKLRFQSHGGGSKFKSGPQPARGRHRLFGDAPAGRRAR